MQAISLFLLFLAFFCITQASHPEDWTQIQRAHADGNFQFRVYLPLDEKNVKALQERVLQVADPTHPDYGRWLSQQQIMDILQPSQEHHDTVALFFHSKGARVKSYGDSLQITAPIFLVEEIFDCSLFLWKHGPTGRHAVRQFGGATIPDEIKDHIDIITGLTGFPIIPNTHSKPESEDQLSKLLDGVRADKIKADYGYVIPDTLRTIYNIPETETISSAGATQAVMEFSPITAPLDSDLQKFGTEAQETYKSFVKKLGPYSEGGFDTESTLDAEYIEGMGKNATNWYWTVGDGWALEMATEIFSQNPRPAVISVSYGWPELRTCQSSVTHAKCQSNDAQAYVGRANTELSKVAGLGVSVLVASQDEGAPSEANISCENKTHPVFSIYPCSSPFVTCVSATTLTPSSQQTTKKAALPPICSGEYQCATGGVEVPCESNNTLYQWTTGGGFSTWGARQTYQTKAQEAYLASGALLPPKDLFPSTMRGYPEISACGSRILIIQNGNTVPSAGTSASTPIVAGIISLLNDQRIKAGKSVLGFLNPLLYKMGEDAPQAFNDITTGDNRCSIRTCCPDGYGAVKGWDAVTGWGTPNYGEMKKYVLSLQ